MIFKQVKVRYVVGLVVLLLGLWSVPVVAQVALEYFAPREVEKPPVPESVTSSTIPAESRVMEIEALENQAGFSLLVPTYVPPDCRFRNGFYLSRPRVVYLQYSCGLTIVQQKTQSIQRPYIAGGSAQEVTVVGEPAMYIDGSWLEISGQEPVWKKGVLKTLVFERNNLLIRIQARPGVTKEQVVQIAESME